MQENAYLKLFNYFKKFLKTCPINNIKSFSNTEIKILGQIDCDIKFEKYGLPTKIIIIVVSDIEEVNAIFPIWK